MLGQLDTFIAFVVVILAVSLVITLLNQAVVAVASFRGLHLRAGIEVLLEQIAPEAKTHARPEDPKTNTRPPGNGEREQPDASRAEEKLREVSGH